MRPLELTMRAFGPYERAEIDFRRLEQNRFFLITGATGSGKTAILDAMSFALYGEATGSKRHFLEMRSTSAGVEADTVVCFIFLLHGQTYRFSRSIHPSKNRKGEIVYKMEAECHRLEGEEWRLLESRAPLAVNKAAEELLGFTHDQFAQIIVLPQGEFRKLLLASSVEKEKILQRLFRTERWIRICAAAGDMAQEAEETLRGVEAERAAVLAREQVTDAAALEEAASEAKKNAATLAEEGRVLVGTLREASGRLAAARALAARMTERARVAERLALLDAQVPGMREQKARLSLARRARAVRPYRDALLQAKEQEKQKRERLKEAQSTASETERRAASALQREHERTSLRESQEALAKQGAVLAQRQEAAVRLSQQEALCAGCSRQLAAAREKEATASQAAERAGRSVEKGELVVQEKRVAAEQVPLLEAKLREARAQADLFVALERARMSFSEAEAHVHAAASAEKTCRVRLQAVAQALEALRAQMRASEAYTLAATLQEGEPCPVCGSLHHPAPARPADLPDSERLPLLEATAREEEKSHSAALEECAAARAAYAAAKARCEECATACAALPLPEEALRKRCAALEQALAAAKEAQRTLPELQALLALRQEQAQQARDALAAAQAEAAQCDTAYKAATSAYKALLAGMNGEKADQAAIQKALAENERRQEETRRALSELENAARADAAAYTRAQEALAAASREALEARQRLEEAGQAEAEAARQNELEPGTDLTPLLLPERELELAQARIDAFEAERLGLQQRLADTEPLADERQKAPDLAALEEAVDEIQRRKGEIDNQTGALSVRLQSLEAALNCLETLQERYGALEARYAQTQRLQRLLGGKNAAKTPIHQFVLGLMLDEILSSANRYFLSLSGGQYTLGRTEGPVRGGGYQGLELEVFDSHRGGRRSVATLSGGEMFLASLSLAFGLADVVQREAGGVSLDSLFIDEGFGTLDAETRETVMHALHQIRQSGRVVGLISHVAELRELIPARIRVEKDPVGGSTVRIEGAE